MFLRSFGNVVVIYCMLHGYTGSLHCDYNHMNVYLSNSRLKASLENSASNHVLG